MALKRIGWENGTLVESAKVLSDGTVQPAQYEGNTPLSAANLTKMEDNTEEFVNEQVGNLEELNTTNKSSAVGAINELLPIVLYETDKTFSAVADNTVISLNDNLSNYKRIVLYGISNNNNLGSVEVYNPTINDQPGMFIAANGSRSGMYAFNGTFRQWLITSENKITYSEATDISSKIVSSSALTGFVSDSISIKIYAILGYKN